MSSGSDVLKHSSPAWSYVSFPRSRRRSSIRLPNHEVRDRRSEESGGSGGGGGRARRLQSMRQDVHAAWMNQGQRSRFLKTGLLITLLLLALYYVASGSNGGAIPAARMFRGGGAKSEVSVATTKKCSASYSSDKPLIQYALMIDAGSTGSRIHVYKFNNCGPTPELEGEVFEMTEKKEGGSGLSSYKEDVEGAAKSLDPLMKVAVDNVPEKFRSCTPIAVKATAGLRKLGTELSDNILKAVRHRLETVYPFPLVDDQHGGVEVMDGKFEGVYAWITTNYLLGNIGMPGDAPTAAVFDLGGGSTQIVFQPTFPLSTDGRTPEEMAEGEHKYQLSFGGRDFTLYQHSYLDYGLMEARKSLHRLVVENMHETNPTSQTWLKNPIINPCLGVGGSREVVVPLTEGHVLGANVTVNMVGPPESSVELCRSLAEKMLNKDKECALAPCAFNGVHQPSLERTFAREDIYLFSYFYDRTQPLGMPESFTLRELEGLASRVCDGGDAWKPFESVPGAIKELQDRPETCLDLNFMLALLNKGYEMPLERQVKIAKKINGNELGWCLGASLPLLKQESGWTCKIKEVI